MNQAANYGFKNVCINVFRKQNVFCSNDCFLPLFFSCPLVLFLKRYCLGQGKLSSGVPWIGNCMDRQEGQAKGVLSESNTGKIMDSSILVIQE